MKESMQQVTSPERVGFRLCNIVSQCTHLVQRPTRGIAQVANHRLVRCIRSAPVATVTWNMSVCSETSYCKPQHTWKITVSVRVVTSEEGIGFVAVDNEVICTDHLEWRSISKVTTVDLGAVGVTQDVLFGMLGQQDGLVQSHGNLVRLGRVAALVDGELGDSADIPSVNGGRRVFARGSALAGLKPCGSCNGACEGRHQEGFEKNRHVVL